MSAMASRPRDRKEQIARVSAEAFSALGYHGVTMDDIASRVGVSATALYRHYSGKYELFRGAVLNLGQQLVDATAPAESSHTGDPRTDFGLLVDALTNTALANRSSGGLYRWQGRFLRPEDKEELDGQLRMVHRSIQAPLALLHPQRTSHARWTSSTAVLSVIGSIVDHRARLPAAMIRALLADLATVIATADLPVPTSPVASLAPVPTSPVASLAPGRSASTRAAGKYEALLDESMRLFNANGYRDTSVEEIAAAVGLPASGVYRYFARKSDLLAASFRRAADVLAGELEAIATTTSDPEEALVAMIACYVRRSFQRPELAYVYFTERVHLSPSDQQLVRRTQTAAVEAWGRLVTDVRSDWTSAEARFAVHAAAALVIDIGRLTGYRNSAETEALVAGLLELTLLGRYRLRMALPAR